MCQARMAHFIRDGNSFTPANTANLPKLESNSIDLVITTEKDAVRLKRLKVLPQGIEILALKIDFSISSNEEALVGRLHSVFDR